MGWVAQRSLLTWAEIDRTRAAAEAQLELTRVKVGALAKWLSQLNEHNKNERPTFGKTNPFRADEGPSPGLPKERMARSRPLTVSAARLRRKILDLL